MTNHQRTGGIWSTNTRGHADLTIGLAVSLAVDDQAFFTLKRGHRFRLWLRRQLRYGVFG